ncbi:MAG: GAF domain-containing protein, partial [Actinobacteria bacterium]|nr:GAF domain-containing protein [Actinomycetota bacterium]
AALERERLVAEISQRLRGQADPGDAIRLAVEEAGRALGATRAYLRLDEDGAIAMGADWTEAGAQALGERAAQLPEAALAVRQRRTAELDDVPAAALNAATRELLERLEARSALATPILARDDVIGVLGFHRGERGRWSPLDTRLAEAVGRELGLALQTARLLEANERRLRQQSALVTAAQTVTSELELETVLERLVDVVVGLLGADAADCWILEGDPPILRCRAVNGLPAEEVGRELEPSGAFAEALEARRPVLRRELPRPGQAEPRAIPRRFEEVMVAPIWSLGEARGVLSVWVRVAGRFRAADLELLGTFGTLASLALRNAEVFEERVRQARSQRGFYRIASVLGRPVSFVGTLDAVAEAAGEVLDGDFACVLMRRADNLYLASSQALPEPLALALREGFDGGGTLAAVAADRRMLVATDVTEDDRFDPAWRRLAVESGYTSLLAIPVAGPRGAEGPGLAIVYFREERRFTDDDLELARHLAGAAHGALERSAVYEEERAARSLAQQLARTGSLLANELDPAAVLQEVVRDAPQLVGVEACAIRTTDGEELVVAAATGEGLEGLVGTRSPVSSWLSGDVVQSGARVALSDAATDERLVAADPILGRGYRAYLGVPLAAPEGALHGVLAVYARRPRVWRNEEIEALLALAANASAVLSNAELYQRVLLERERSVAILSSIADGIVAVDRQGAVVLWNQAAEQITGVAAREAVGRTPLQLLGRDLESGEGAPEGNRLLSIPRSGGELWLSLTEAVMHDPSGAVAGRVYAFRDISADRSVEQMKSDFVSAVSQELRRPLTSVYGFAETLLRNDVLFGEVERRVFLGYIASESARLTKIVDRLLSVARLDAGDLQVAVAPTDVRPLVSEAVASVESNGHRLVVDLPVEPVTASTDAEKLRQVLANLLDNAVKFSPEGGTVTVTAREAGDDAVELRVTDEGIGIPSGELARIFGKFYRHERGGRSVEGTGLGLFIAQGLVEAMGGRISVASVEGEGASFTLRLPRA